MIYHFLAIFLFLLNTLVYCQNVDSIQLINKRFAEEQDFFAVMALDSYLDNKSDLNLEFWRIWGDISTENLIGAEKHLHEISEKFKIQLKENPCDYSRFLLLEGLNLFYKQQAQLVNIEQISDKKIRNNLKKIHNSKCFYAEDLKLLHFLKNFNKSRWHKNHHGKISTSSGYSTNPLRDEDNLQQSDAKAFQEFSAYYSYTPWLSHPISPYLNISTNYTHFYPKAHNILHKGNIHTQAGSFYDFTNLSLDFRLLGSLFLQADTLFPNQSIAQELKSVQLSISFMNKLNFRITPGQRLFREKKHSRNKVKFEAFLFDALTEKLLLSVGGGYANYNTNDSWYNFTAQQVNISVFYNLGTKLELMSLINLSHRNFPYESGIERHDWIINWHNIFNIKLSDYFNVSLNYNFFNHKIENYKVSEFSLNENIHLTDHVLSINFEYQPKLYINHSQQYRDNYEYAPPWSVKNSFKNQSNLDEVLDKFESKIQQQETQIQGRGGGCKE